MGCTMRIHAAVCAYDTLQTAHTCAADCAYVSCSLRVLITANMPNVSLLALMFTLQMPSQLLASQSPVSGAHGGGSVLAFSDHD